MGKRSKPKEEDRSLTPAEVADRIAKLSDADGRTRCHAALHLCHAAQAGTDIRPAIPALAEVAARPHGSELDAMWAQHALRSAAFHGADLRPALPALLGKLAESVNQYAVHALRTWASRSTEAAGEALAGCREAPKGKSFFGMENFLEELEFLSKRLVPDAEATWKTGRRRGVSAVAGRLLWLTSGGWDLEQSFPHFLGNGPPREDLRYRTGTWVVPLAVINAARGWLGQPPLSEAPDAPVRRALEQDLERLRSETYSISADACAVCREIGRVQGGSPLEGYKFPPCVAELVALDLAGDYRRCPRCGRFYEYEYTRECEVFEPETDHECVRAITFEELAKGAREATFGTE